MISPSVSTSTCPRGFAWYLELKHLSTQSLAPHESTFSPSDAACSDRVYILSPMSRELKRSQQSLAVSTSSHEMQLPVVLSPPR